MARRLPKELQQTIRAVGASLCHRDLDIPLVEGSILYNRETSYNTTTEVEDALPAISYDLPLPALTQLLELAHRIQLLTSLWLKTHIKRLNSLHPQHLSKSSFVFTSYPFRKYPDGKDYKFVRTGPASWVEEYRITRALWRYQLFCLLADSGTRLSARTDDVAPFIECAVPFRQEEFNRIMSVITKWEWDEMLCIQDYLDSSRISLRTPPSTHDDKCAPQSHHGVASHTFLAPAAMPTPSPQKRPAPLKRASSGFQKCDDVIAVKRSSEAFNFFHRYGLRHPTSPLQRSQWENFRRLGFGIWDQERMCQMELFRLPPSVRDERGVKDLSIDDVGFTWRSIEAAGAEDVEFVIKAPPTPPHSNGVRSSRTGFGESQEELVREPSRDSGGSGGGHGRTGKIEGAARGLKGLMRRPTKNNAGSGTSGSSPRTSFENY